MLLVVPPGDREPLPTLGDQVCAFLQERAVHGPGSLKGQPLTMDCDFRYALLRLYEHWPRGHSRAGRRRFKRGGVSLRKGSAKTELLALVAFAELHPESPVRFNGWNADGTLRQGRPVANPYIPLLANTQEQVAELAYGALMVMCDEGADPELFDVGLDRIIRLGERGEADGKALPLSLAPNARDGARTTWQGIDEPHRLYLPNHKAAVETMLANLEKRAPEDPWQLTATTAGELGQKSVAEDEYGEADLINRGLIERPTFFFLHRAAADGYDWTKREDRIEAITEASGPDVRKWSDIESIAAQWERPGADTAYLERVWGNRWVAASRQAFDSNRWHVLGLTGERIPRRSWVTLGFDGARHRDSTAIVMTDMRTGFQELVGLWEREPDADDEWEVPEADVSEKVAELMHDYRVLKFYCDPPHWTNTIGEWSVRHRAEDRKDPEIVQAWPTNQRRAMFRALRAFREAMTTGKVSHNGDPDLERHIGNAGRVSTNLWDDEEDVNGETGQQRVWILGKLHPDRKFDAAMAAVLSWQARLDNLGNIPKRKRGVVARIR